MVKVQDVTCRKTIADHCVLAVSFWWRLRGLMFRRGFGPFDALWLAPTSDIHMFWVWFPIDLIWLDADLNVVGLKKGVKPWRLASCRQAMSVLETPTGVIERCGVQVGDRITLGQ